MKKRPFKTEGQITCCIIIASLTLLSIGLHLSAAPSKPAVFITLFGCFFYTVLIQFNRMDIYYRCDYIQTGEGSLLLLCLTVGILFKLHPAQVLILFFCISFFLVIFQKVIIELKANEIFISGIYINGLSIIIGIFIILTHNVVLLTPVHFFFINGMILPYFILLLVPAIISVILLPGIKPMLQLYSQGKSIYTISGYSYNVTLSIISAVRSLLLTAVFATTGLCGGIAVYFYCRKTVLSEINSILLLILYSQLLHLLTITIKQPLILLVPVIISYIVWTASEKKIYHCRQG